MAAEMIDIRNTRNNPQHFQLLRRTSHAQHRNTPLIGVLRVRALRSWKN
jgi:hypothetical protein